MAAGWWLGVPGHAMQASGPGNAPPSTADDKKGDQPLGSYSLVITVLEPSETTHLLTPSPSIAVNGGTEREPADLSGDTTVPAQMVIDSFGTPRDVCVATVPKLHGCDALDRTDLTLRDPNTIGYHIVSHGAAVTLQVNLEVRDLLPLSHGSAEIPWHAGDVIFVAVPRATPAYRFLSEVLVGRWNDEAVVFEVGKDLPPSAKKALEDLGVKQDLGDHVLYSFRVKPPGK
ncbi:MAG TPA: hypothetical protein VL990_17300 [Acidobacteriaceae bacterium]|nr:hypothetical protein [Acidobacteriaceae bacterium]